MNRRRIRNVILHFFSFVEIKTKLASVLPFLCALAYAFYLTGGLNWRSTLIFLAGDLLFDMSVTAINMHLDKRESGEKPHYPTAVSLAVIFGLIGSAAVFGLYVAYLHGLAVLLAGFVCFAAGIAYTFGPMPISKSPYGELVSGFVEGFVLMFIVTAINTPGYLIADITVSLETWRALIHLDGLNLLRLALVTAPASLCIANIMLANNTCDLEIDWNRRYTMPRHIGLKNALRLYGWLYYAVYVLIAAASLTGAVPPLCLLTLATLVPVGKNIRRFREKQTKPETFPLSIMNFALITAVFTATLAAGAWLARV